MQFISDRESLAEQFIYKTQQNSSYLLSSRASRRRVIYEDSFDQADIQIENFKNQINEKYQNSVINKIYTFPVDYETDDMFNNEDLQHLQGQIYFSLRSGQPLLGQYKQTQSGFLKEKTLNKNQAAQSKGIMSNKANKLLQNIKKIKEKHMFQILLSEDNLQQQKLQGQKRCTTMRAINEKKDQVKKIKVKNIYQTFKEQQEKYRRKKLNTQPYQKPFSQFRKK